MAQVGGPWLFSLLTTWLEAATAIFKCCLWYACDDLNHPSGVPHVVSSALRTFGGRPTQWVLPGSTWQVLPKSFGTCQLTPHALC
jgi:hypothetical protein